MKKIITIFFLTLISSCATGINPKQKLAYQVYQEKGLLVENRNPNLAMKMGFLPGGSSFYNGDYDVAFFNLFLWPISIAWEAGNGRSRAMLLNYEETENEVRKNFKKGLSELDELNNLGEITEKEYRADFTKLYEKFYNPKSTLLARYKIGIWSAGSTNIDQNDDSFLSRVDRKIGNTCNKEFNIMKKELKVLDKDNFLHKCAISKRKNFVGLGL